MGDDCQFDNFEEKKSNRLKYFLITLGVVFLIFVLLLVVFIIVVKVSISIEEKKYLNWANCSYNCPEENVEVIVFKDSYSGNVIIKVVSSLDKEDFLRSVSGEIIEIRETDYKSFIGSSCFNNCRIAPSERSFSGLVSMIFLPSSMQEFTVFNGVPQKITLKQRVVRFISKYVLFIDQNPENHLVTYIGVCWTIEMPNLSDKYQLILQQEIEKNNLASEQELDIDKRIELALDFDREMGDRIRNVCLKGALDKFGKT